MAIAARVSGQVKARTHTAPAAWLRRKVEPFFAIGQVSGGPLLIATLVALVAVNSPWSAEWGRIWERPVRVSYGAWTFGRSAAEWINDALMPLFFLIIGTEVKREFAKGSLSSRATAVFPLVGAVGGFVVPVAIYWLINRGTDTAGGWGVVAAMDTAFSLAIVAMFASRLPPSVRAVLLAFAAIDDVFGLLVIALAYTAAIDGWFLLLAAGAYVSILALLRLRWVTPIPYVLLGLLVWVGVFGSGVHPTIAGVALGLLLPTSSRLSPEHFTDRVAVPLAEVHRASHAARSADDEETIERERARAQAPLGYIHEMAAATDEAAERLVRVLTPWVSYVALPLFALSNVRIHFSADLIAQAMHAPLSLGIVAGLVIGKPLGFLASTWIATRAGAAKLPDGVSWPMVAGIGAVAGIGFTLSLFIAELAFEGAAETEQAALAILVASVISGVFGYAMFWKATRAGADA